MTYPRDRGVLHGVAKVATADFFASHISPKYTPCTFRIQISVSGATKLYAAVLHDGANEKKMVFNGNQDLVADTVYMFDLLVHQGDTVNYETDDNVTVHCRVQELPIGNAVLVDPI